MIVRIHELETGLEDWMPPPAEATYPVAVPTLVEARKFTENAFQSLSTRDREIRMRLCSMIEESVMVSADDENLDVLRASAYLQEIGVIHSSRDKATFSLSTCAKFFDFIYGDLDPRLLDCIANHVRGRVPQTAEGRLMQICHKYVTSHFLDYIRMKGRISIDKVDKLTMRRLDALDEYLKQHPRGTAINSKLQAWFHGLTNHNG